MREVFVNRRVAAESGGAFVLALALFAIGVAIAPAMVRVFADAAGVHAMVMTGPSDVLAAGVELGLALALTMLLGWVALVVHRARARRAPPVLALVAYGAVPLAAALAGLSLSVQTVAAIGGEAVGGVRPMLAVRDLLPGLWTVRVTLLAGLALSAGAFVVGGRRRA